MDSSKTDKINKVVEKFVRRVGKRRTLLAYFTCQKTWRKGHRPRHLRIGREISFEFNSLGQIKELTPQHVVVRVYFVMKSPTGVVAVYADTHVICEKGPYVPHEDGRWGVNPNSFLKFIPDGQQST